MFKVIYAYNKTESSDIFKHGYYSGCFFFKKHKRWCSLHGLIVYIATDTCIFTENST